ncbi:hypothetical protein ABTZ03_08645 [Kitasatospora sp. NPDC096077]|uniref:effector-associated constant component EACC1 n=1 Tax=Kitasatospora sp. NPDC096077 TaxID=3155544 RepID=UPI003328E586
MTEIQIRLAGRDTIGETAALWEWLREEDEFRGRVRAVTRPPGAGELGGAVEVLQVALGTTGAAGVLARSLTVWMRTRRSDVKITVSRSPGGDTTTVEVTHLDPGKVEEVLRAALDGTPEHGTDLDTTEAADADADGTDAGGTDAAGSDAAGSDGDRSDDDA